MDSGFNFKHEQVATKNKTFICSEDDPTQGSEVITFETPDSISSFIISAISFDDAAGGGVADDPPALVTFKPFFIQMDLPFSIRQSETLVQTITVFNYMETSQAALISVVRDEMFVIDEAIPGWDGEKSMLRVVHLLAIASIKI